eukprot:s3541_g2.t1
MHRMLVVAVSLCLASRAGAARVGDVRLHQGQEGFKEKYEKDLTGQDATLASGKVQEDPDPVCCRCKHDDGASISDKTEKSGTCSEPCYPVPSVNCGLW